MFATNENGEVRVGGLWSGEYRFQETDAAPGYARFSIIWTAGSTDGTFTIEIDGDKKVVLEATNKNTENLTMEFRLRKIDADRPGTTLAGVQFQLYRIGDDGNETPVGGSRTTDADGFAAWSGLAVGDYSLVETSAPPGYQLPQGADARYDFQVRYDATGNVLWMYVNGVRQGDLLISRTNTKERGPTGDVRLRKVDADNSRILLSGTVFQLYRIDENGAETPAGSPVITGPDGMAAWSELAEGDYRLVGEKAPDGYLLPIGDDVAIAFALHREGDALALYIGNVRQDSLTIRWENKKIDEPTGDVRLRKVDADDSRILLSGAVFQLFRLESGSYVAHGMPVATGSDGRAWWALTAGEYRLVEQRAPGGYILPGGTAARLDFELRESGGALALYVNGVRQPSLVITRANTRTPTTPPGSGGGYGGGGGGGSRTPDRDRPAIMITDGDVPLTTIGEAGVPLAELPDSLVTIDDGDVPLAGLPQTGGMPVEAFLALGVCLMAGGSAVKIRGRRRRAKKQVDSDR